MAPVFPCRVLVIPVVLVELARALPDGMQCVHHHRLIDAKGALGDHTLISAAYRVNTLPHPSAVQHLKSCVNARYTTFLLLPHAGHLTFRPCIGCDPLRIRRTSLRHALHHECLPSLIRVSRVNSVSGLVTWQRVQGLDADVSDMRRPLCLIACFAVAILARIPTMS